MFFKESHDQGTFRRAVVQAKSDLITVHLNPFISENQDALEGLGDYTVLFILSQLSFYMSGCLDPFHNTDFALSNTGVTNNIINRCVAPQ